MGLFAFEKPALAGVPWGLTPGKAGGNPCQMNSPRYHLPERGGRVMVYGGFGEERG